MTILHFETTAEKSKRLTQEFATRIGRQSALDDNYDSGKDPVLQNLLKQMDKELETPTPRKRSKSKRR